MFPINIQHVSRVKLNMTKIGKVAQNLIVLLSGFGCKLLILIPDESIDSEKL